MGYYNAQPLSQKKKTKVKLLENFYKLKFSYVSGEKQHRFSLESLFPVHKTFHVQYHKYPRGGLLVPTKEMLFSISKKQFCFPFLF